MVEGLEELLSLPIKEVEQLLKSLSPADRAAINKLLLEDMVKTAWRPLPGPQSLAYYSEATVTGYGGAAGGGKTDLAIGKALTQHRRTFIHRRVGTELTAVEDRIAELLGNSTTGYNSQKKIWRPPRFPGIQIELGSTPNLGDEEGYRGRPHDFKAFDEVTNTLEHQVRFLLGWLRTTIPGQRCESLLTFNPPTDVEGRWVIKYFAPWIDPDYKGTRAQPGELRWFVNLDGQEREWHDGLPFTHKGEDILPQSRTFIPSRVTDNPFLKGTGYVQTLQSLPEPLRSQMLYGDFSAGLVDDIWQVIPSAWIDAAMQRWEEPKKKPEMLTVGVDVSRGGSDKSVIARKHEGLWFDVPIRLPGMVTLDGALVAGQVIGAVRNQAPINIDVIGVGASPFDFLRQANQDVRGVNVSETATAPDRTGLLTFANQRSQIVWNMRELLDPQYNTGIALPPDEELKRDLCAFTWKVRGRTIYVSSRDEIVAKLGHSPDAASAYFLAAIDTPRVRDVQVPMETGIVYDPLDRYKGASTTQKTDYNPLKFR